MNRRRSRSADRPRRQRRLRPRPLILELLERRSLLAGGLDITATNISATAMTSFMGSLGEVTDADPNAYWIGITVDWGDGSSDSIEVGTGTDVAIDDSHTYASPGTYTITLSAYDSDGNDSSSSATATVAAPSGWGMSLSASNINATADTSSTFTLGAVSDPYASWVDVSVYWGDGSVDSVEVGPGNNVPIQDSHTYASPGTYTVTLTADDSNDNDETATATATVTAPSGWGLALSASNINATAGTSPNFTLGAVSDPYASWVMVSIDWGDGSYGSTEVGPGNSVPIQDSHTYASPGTYTVTLSAQDSDDNNATAAATATITAPSQPGINLNAANISATADTPFTFALGTVSDPLASWVSVSINWGDGSSDSTEVGAGTDVPIQDSHTYASPGTYTVTLTADDSNGDEATATATATVTIPVGWGLSLNASDITATAREAFTGVVGTVSDPYAAWVGVTINWGDGSSDSTEIGPGNGVPIQDSHTYEWPGTYTVTLTADDSDGNTATAIATATVVTPPGWGLSLSAFDVSEPLDQPFSGPIGSVSDPWASYVSISINWGDGSSDSEEIGPGNAVRIDDYHQYAADGIYTFTISASDSDGNTASASGTVIVWSGIDSLQSDLWVTGQNISAVASQPFIGDVGTLRALNEPGTTVPVLIAWGDGSSTEEDVTLDDLGTAPIPGNHTYDWPGTYTVTISADGATSGPAFATSDANVSLPSTSPDLTVSVQAPTPSAGEEFSGSVGTLTDTDGSPVFVAIDWGDGSPPTDEQVDGGTNVSIPGDHTYATAGSYTINVQAVDANGNWGSADAATAVAPALTVTPGSITAIAGQQFSASLGTITDTSLGAVSVEVNWGDGSVDWVNVDIDGNTAVPINDSHTYTTAGTYSIVLSASDANGNLATETDTVDVSPPTTTPSFAVTVGSITATAGQVYTGSVGTITDPGASSVSAVVNWGDGTSDTLTVNVDSAEPVPLYTSHTYAAAGNYPITISAIDSNGGTGSGNGTATVSGAAPPLPLTVTASTVPATAGEEFTGCVGTFTDPSALSVSVVVSWGDGSSDLLTIDGGTAVPIRDTHTYTAAGDYAVTIRRPAGITLPADG